MFPNWIDRRSRQKRETKQQTNKEKPRKKNENNSTYHEPLSKEWVGRRS